MANKCRVPGELDDEQVIIYERRHWFTIVTWIGGRPIILLFISLVIVWLVTTTLEPAPGTGLIYWLFMLFPALAWIGWKALDWGNDRYIVTNKRIIHCEKVYFLFQSQTEAYLDKVQDVTIEIINPFANVLNFGDLTIETAGKAGAIEFQSISRPRDVQRQLLELAGLPAKEKEDLSQPKSSVLRKRAWRMLYPTYPTKEEGAIVWRKHWWVLNSDLAFLVLATGVLAIVWLWALTSLHYPGWVNVIFGLGLVTTATWAVVRLIDWHNDLYILTEDRVIDIEKKPFVLEHRREANLSSIQDVSFVQPNLIAKVLDFGDVLLQTAGRAGEFTFDSVPHPGEVQATIARRLNEFRQRKTLADEARQRAEIVSVLEDYLRQAQADNR